MAAIPFTLRHQNVTLRYIHQQYLQINYGNIE